MLERCQLEPLRPDQCQRQQPGTGTGSRPRRPRYAPGCTRRSRSHRQCRPKARAAAHAAPSALAFFFCAAFPPARTAGSAARRALGVVGSRPGEKLESTRERWTQYPDITPTTCTASAAPMTTQPTSCTACTPCQTSQQPAAHRQHLPTPHPASPAAHLPQQITPPTAKNHPPQPAAGGVRFST